MGSENQIAKPNSEMDLVGVFRKLNDLIMAFFT
jgi:hypothetical protein